MLPPKFDAFAASAQHDPYPTYARLRAAGALCRAGPGQWAVTRYAEVAALLRDERLAQFQFTEGYRLLPESARHLALRDGPARSFTRRTVVALDRPAHTPMRRLLTKVLVPRLAGLDAQIASMTDRLLDRAAERGGLDAVTELAQPLPFGVLCELLGLPAEDHDEVAARAAALAAGFAPVVSPAASAAADEAVTWLRGYFGGLLARRRRGAGTDVLSRMRVDDDADGITDDQLADNAIFLILAGLETSINLLTTGCLALARHPDQAAVLRADPSLVPGAVEEFLRYDAPTRMTARLATAPIEVDGRTIREGRVILLLIGSANHDERVFDQPERLDVSRRPNRHLSFGAGIHHCLGAALARMQSAVVFDRLVRRFPVIEPAGAPTRDAGIGQRSYATAPLRMEPAH